MKWIYFIASLVFFILGQYSIDSKDYGTASTYYVVAIIDIIFYCGKDIKDHIDKNK